MNAEYINPFIKGSQDVISMICGEIPSLGKLFIKNAPYSAFPVTITVSIFGGVAGTVVYTMREDAGCYIASKMMMGMPVPAFDDMSKSAVAELANMISGNVATIFSDKSVIVDITPPNFQLNAASANLPSFKDSVVCIPLVFQNGMVFEIDICLA